MKQKLIKGLLIMIVLYLSYHMFINYKEWRYLTDLHAINDKLAQSKFVISNSEGSDWLELGAVNVDTNYESGIRRIHFPAYTVSYQAFDERDDILGGIIEQRNGNEAIGITVSLPNDFYIESVDFKENEFLFSSQNELFEKIYFLDGKIVKKGDNANLATEDLQIACNELLHNIEDFKEISTILFQETYEEIVKTQKLCMGYGFFCIILLVILGCFIICVEDKDNLRRKKDNESSVNI